MATLEKLRNRLGVLVAAVIGLALLAFILGDLFRSGSNLINKRQYEIAEINGKSISYQEFATRLEIAATNYKNNAKTTEVNESTYQSLRNQVWSNLLDEHIMQKQYEALGIDCSSEELFDMIQGNNIHPSIKAASLFTNEITGQFDPALVIRYLKNMQADQTGQAQAAWIEYEKQLMADRINTKYINLITKGLYITSDKVDQDYLENNRKYSFDYITKRFTTVNDTLVNVSEKEVEEYFNSHHAEFKQEASRDISYVTFDVVASDKDKQNIETWINDQAIEFKRIENAEQYIRLNADSGFDNMFYKASELEQDLQTWVDTVEVGSVYGPYLVDQTWKLARIIDIKVLPDSVRASHIVIPPDSTNSIVGAQATIDSLKELVDKGADFAKLAQEFGTDGSSEKGGDLGWFTQRGQMVETFSDPCFFANKGDVITITTNFGVHLVKITDQGPKSKKYQIGILDRKIEPGQDTYQAFYSSASRFASTYNSGSKFEEGINEMNLTRRVANNLGEADQVVSGLESPRQLIRWAYEAKKGDLSEIFEFGNRYVIARLDEVREKGTSTLDQVYGEVESIVRNNKKAEYLTKEFANIDKSKSLEDIGAELNLTVKNIETANFASLSIPGIGVEPAISAALSKIPEGEISDPIVGKNGIFIIRTSSIQNPEQAVDVLATRTRLQQSLASRSRYQARQALEDNAKVTDKRNKFY